MARVERGRIRGKGRNPNKRHNPGRHEDRGRDFKKVGGNRPGV